MADPSNCTDLTQHARDRGLSLSTNNYTIGTQVNVTCADSAKSLQGQGQLSCHQNGTWSSSLPYCEGDLLSDREVVIIAASCTVIGVLLIFLVVVAICYFKTRANSKRQREERLAATLERLSIRDPLDELVRRESRRSSYGNPAFTSSSADDDIEKSKLYKVWDCTRTCKQFVFAENLDELVAKGGEKLGLSGPIRVVLEEDGTEVDNDAVLRACAGMVLLLLEQNQVWAKPEVLLSVHEYSNNLHHYRYDVDEKL